MAISVRGVATSPGIGIGVRPDRHLAVACGRAGAPKLRAHDEPRICGAIPTSAIVRAASITITVSDKASQSYGLFEVLRAWGGPVQQLDVSSALGMAVSDEADLEDAARVGDRIYVVSSHGRDKDGVLSPSRFRFFAMDLAGAVPASDPSPTNPSRLIIGLRNPRLDDRAILVTLENPAEAIAGGTAHFGEVVALDLGGLGVRGMAWSEAHQAILIIAGPPADVGTAAEAVVPYPGTKAVQVLFDDGALAAGGGKTCKKLSASAKSFTDQIVHVE